MSDSTNPQNLKQPDETAPGAPGDPTGGGALGLAERPWPFGAGHDADGEGGAPIEIPGVDDPTPETSADESVEPVVDEAEGGLIEATVIPEAELRESPPEAAVPEVMTDGSSEPAVEERSAVGTGEWVTPSDEEVVPAPGEEEVEPPVAGSEAEERGGIGNLELARQAIEAALLSAPEPLSAQTLRRLFEPDIGAELMNRLLTDLQTAWQGRSAELVRLASGWRFQTRSELQPYLDRLRETRAPKYSRAVLETLAIIVYRQPVTRGDIEEIRGVTVSSQIMKLLETRGWIDTIGHRDTPGRPALYATTKKFLDDLGLRSLTELPPLAELEGVLDLVDTAEAASSTPAEQSESPSPDWGEPPAQEQSSNGASASEGRTTDSGY